MNLTEAFLAEVETNYKTLQRYDTMDEANQAIDRLIEAVPKMRRALQACWDAAGKSLFDGTPLSPVAIQDIITRELGSGGAEK